MQGNISEYDGRFFAQIVMVYSAHEVKLCSVFKPRFFKTRKGAEKAVQKCIDLNRHLYVNNYERWDD